MFLHSRGPMVRGAKEPSDRGGLAARASSYKSGGVLLSMFLLA